MSGPSAQLMDQVIQVVRALPSVTVEALAVGLEEAPDWSRVGVPAVQAFGPAAHRWQDLWKTAFESAWCSPSRLATLLRGAAAMETAWRREVALDVAWTGPTPPLSTLRRTEQALLEVIEAARKELWVMTFAAYRVARVCDAMLAAAQRGCRVRLLLESESESQGKLSSGGVDEMPGDVRASCEVYVWPHELRPKDARGHHGILHAKCAVADGQVVFVGSANLTEFAFELNVELGLLLRNAEAAAVVERQLRWLVESGTMVRL